MISVRTALELVLKEISPLGRERVALLQALGRGLAESVHAERDVPPFRNSAMDGYAVRSADVASASQARPVRLRVLETISAGSLPRREVSEGTAIKIMTGSPMPNGADAVVRIEDTVALEEIVEIQMAARPGANVREAGEDMRTGDVVLQAGQVLRPADLGLLVSLGRPTVAVWRRPEVAILATGDELVELGQPLGPGQIANSNAYTLAAAVEEAGARPRILGIVGDDVDAARGAFTDALDSDMVLSTGGVSMGTFDLVRETLRGLGVEERFWKVAQKPGKPLSFGMRGPTPVFGLPGNPVSSLVCFYVYVRPALRAMMGMTALHLPVIDAQIETDVQTTAGLTDFVRCVLDRSSGRCRARVTGSQSSGVLRSMSLGGGLIIAPPEVATIPRNSTVRVLRLDDGAREELPV